MNIGGPLLLIGCGKMGGALLGGWLERGAAPAGITVIEPQAAGAARFEGAGVNLLSGPEALAADYAPAVVVIAVTLFIQVAGWVVVLGFAAAMAIAMVAEDRRLAGVTGGALAE